MYRFKRLRLCLISRKFVGKKIKKKSKKKKKIKSINYIYMFSFYLISLVI